MMARITRLLLAAQALAALAAAYALHRYLQQSLTAALAWAAALVVMVRFLIVGNNFFLSYWYGSPLAAHQRLTRIEALYLLCREFSASMWNSSWLMPFRRFEKAGSKNNAALPVLLVHGYGGNSGYWRPMSKALAETGIAHYTLDLEPVFADIDSYVSLIEDRIEHICRETGQTQVVVVAHSMGGLAVRAFLRARGTARIARVITLGTPHHGTVLANFSSGANCVQMSRLGPRRAGRPHTWLQTIGDTEDDELRGLFTSIYSLHDNIIAPQDSSHLPGAKNMALTGIGHVMLAFSPRVHAIVIEEIRESAGRAAKANAYPSANTAAR